jgi:hypothetical protein
MRKLALLFYLILLSQVINAQGKKALYREKFIEGNHLMVEKNYPLALVN